MPRRIIKDARISFISSVDRPAQENARALLMKRDDSGSKIEKAVVMTTSERGHSHILVTGNARSGHTSYDRGEVGIGHEHPWIMDDNGNIVIGEAEGHTHEIKVMTKNQGEGKMAKEEKTSEPEVTLPEDMKKMQAELERANTIIGLKKSARDYFDTLEGEEAQNEFLAKSESEREALVKAFVEGNEIVYTSLDGETFRKSDDPRLVTMAKRADEATKLAKAEREAREQEELSKRATAFGNLKGTEDQKARILKAFQDLPEEDRKVAEEILASANGLAKSAFTEKGTSEESSESDDHPEAKIQKMAKARMEESGEDYYTSYTKVCEAHPDLVREMADYACAVEDGD